MPSVIEAVLSRKIRHERRSRMETIASPKVAMTTHAGGLEYRILGEASLPIF